MPKSGIFYLANMSFNAVCENKYRKYVTCLSKKVPLAPKGKWHENTVKLRWVLSNIIINFAAGILQEN